MWFYVAYAIIFSIYSIDLLYLFISSLIARLHEHRNPTVTRKATEDAKKAAKKEGKQQEGKNKELGITADATGKDAIKPSQPSGFSGVEDFPHLRALYTEYPKVIIQLPMYNEEAHADLIIYECCKVVWPSNRVLIQVCDDSTKESVRKKVDAAVIAAIEKGHQVQLIRRDNRQGFKAGAMVEGMERVAGQGYEYVAIFDADFQPPADFLLQTVYHLMTQQRSAFVQTRWVYTNGYESLLTWSQKVNLDFHFEVEQRARHFLGNFFNFNGTAGVWRIKAIEDAGGWESDTVVEDMDLSLRCYLKGWHGVYLHDVESINELPSTLSSYKTQQFRWLSGPMQIVRKSMVNIFKSKDIGFFAKINCYWFFARYSLFAIVTFAALLAPPIVLWLDPWVWSWYTIWFIVSANVATVVYLYFTWFSYIYMLFAVVLGYFKAWAMFSGIAGLKKSKSWKVTLKFACNNNLQLFRNYHKPYFLEFVLGAYYLSMVGFAMWYQQWVIAGYSGLMAFAFIFVSFGDYFL